MLALLLGVVLLAGLVVYVASHGLGNALQNGLPVPTDPVGSPAAAAEPNSTATPRIIEAQQITAEEGYAPGPPADLLKRAEDLAADRDGQLIMLRGAGHGGIQTEPAVSLRIDREPGQPETDAPTRTTKVDDLVAQSLVRSAAVVLTDPGRDLIGLLAAVSSALGTGQNDVWLDTFCLPTVDPADVRILMSADPTQAVASLAGSLPDLHGARIHLRLAPAAGIQPRLNLRTARWRHDFCIGLLRQAGAEVVTVDEIRTVENAAPTAPQAPVIPLLPEPTTPLPAPPPVPGHPSPPTITAALDTATTFLPDTDGFAVTDDVVLGQLQPIIAGCASPHYAHTEALGRTAQIGPRPGALLLSAQRATRVADLLKAHGCRAVTSRGIGFDQPLPPNPQDPANRSVTVTLYTSG